MQSLKSRRANFSRRLQLDFDRMGLWHERAPELSSRDRAYFRDFCDDRAWVSNKIIVGELSADQRLVRPSEEARKAGVKLVLVSCWYSARLVMAGTPGRRALGPGPCIVSE